MHLVSALLKNNYNNNKRPLSHSLSHSMFYVSIFLCILFLQTNHIYFPLVPNKRKFSHVLLFILFGIYFKSKSQTIP